MTQFYISNASKNGIKSAVTTFSADHLGQRVSEATTARKFKYVYLSKAKAGENPDYI